MRVAERAEVAEDEADDARPDTGEAQSLDLGPLPGLVSYALRRAHNVVFARFRAIFGELEVRPVQLGILTIVANNPGLKQSDVSAALGIKRANFVPLLDALAARGLIRRMKVAADRRSHALVLTRAGQALLAECQSCEAVMEGELAAILGREDRDRLIGILAKLEAAGPERE